MKREASQSKKEIRLRDIMRALAASNAAGASIVVISETTENGIEGYDVILRKTGFNSPVDMFIPKHKPEMNQSVIGNRQPSCETLFKSGIESIVDEINKCCYDVFGDKHDDLISVYNTMMTTGNKDAVGMDICDGDILLSEKFYDVSKRVIRYDVVKAAFVVDEYICGDSADMVVANTYYLGELNTSEFYVAGNVYENADLLKHKGENNGTD